MISYGFSYNFKDFNFSSKNIFEKKNLTNKKKRNPKLHEFDFNLRFDFIFEPNNTLTNFREQKEIKTVSKSTTLRMPSAPTQHTAEEARLLG